jgi:hypothetical protein
MQNWNNRFGFRSSPRKRGLSCFDFQYGIPAYAGMSGCRGLESDR